MVVLQTEDLRIVRFAQACGIFGHRVQHRLNRRGRDDAQHLRGGVLLLHHLDKALTRVGDLPSACFELLFEIGAGLASSTNARLRSGQMKLATSRLALRPCARQGYLHRRTNPECWPSQVIKVGYAIPIILVTGYPNDVDRARALNDGVVCYLRKPVDEQYLIRCLRAALESAEPGERNS